jgi:calcineurin-like phosphoesterase family protein
MGGGAVSEIYSERGRGMIYYTADLHLGHENAIKFDQRPFACVEEMDEALIRNWNARVTDRDRIYIAGDLIFRSKRAPEWYLERLRGIKYLVIGNHEQAILKSERALRYFEDVGKMMYVKDGKNHICICHFPLAEWNGYYRGHYHIFGHIHASRNRAFRIMREEPRAFNAGCMLYQYRPVTFEELALRRQKNCGGLE